MTERDHERRVLWGIASALTLFGVPVATTCPFLSTFAQVTLGFAVITAGIGMLTYAIFVIPWVVRRRKTS